MASFETGDFAKLQMDLRELAALPNSVQGDMLKAGAEVLLDGQKHEIMAMGIYDGNSKTEHVVDSLHIGNVKRGSRGKMSLYISPQGTRRRGNTTTRNGEILFINEFGRPARKKKNGEMGKKIPARPAVLTACEKYAEQVVEAEYKVYDNYLKSKNL